MTILYMQKLSLYHNQSMIENINRNVRTGTQERGCSVMLRASKLSLKNLKTQTTKAIVVIIYWREFVYLPRLERTDDPQQKDPMPSFTEVVNVIFFWGNDDMTPSIALAHCGETTSFRNLVGPPGCYLFRAVLTTWDVRAWHTALQNFCMIKPNQPAGAW